MPLTLTRSASVSTTNAWTLRLFTLLVWFAAGLCAAYWVLKFSTTMPVQASVAQSAPPFIVDTNAVAKMLGAKSGGSSQGIISVSKNKFSLFGLATSPSGQGIALIAVDDKPAKPYYVGAKITDDLVLKSISQVDATLASSSSAPDGQKLVLPERKPGTMIASTSQQAGSTPPVTPPVIAPGNNSAIVPINPARIADAAQAATSPAAMAATSAIANTFSNTNIENARPISRFAPRVSATPDTAGTTPSEVLKN